MPAAPKPSDERLRLAELRRYAVLDTPAEERFDRLTRLASRLLDVPISLVSLVDADRQWFKSRVGLDATETPRDLAFCAHAILDSQPLVINDALADARFADNPLVTADPNIKFYAGAPLISPSGHRLGTLCAIDRQPRTLRPDQLSLLTDLAAIAVDELELSAALAKATEHVEALKQRNDDLDAFVSAVSHDLRGPIRRIRTLCELIGEESAQQDPELLEHVILSATAADTLLVNLRDFFEAKRVPATVQCDAEEALASARDALADKIQHTGATVDSGALPRLTMPAGLLTSLFTNLIDNAVKYCGERTPRVMVSCRRADTHWEFTVADNGLGIANEDHARIFEPLTRVHATVGADGSGLGLAICARIVANCGGTIGVTSTLGRGSTFTFTIPVSVTDAT